MNTITLLLFSVFIIFCFILISYIPKKNTKLKMFTLLGTFLIIIIFLINSGILKTDLPSELGGSKILDNNFKKTEPEVIKPKFKEVKTNFTKEAKKQLEDSIK